MNADLIRAELVAELRTVCAPTDVADEEPDLIVDVGVCVCWVGTTSESLGWKHFYEVRIILPNGKLAVAHFAERDRLATAILERLYHLELGDSRKASRPSMAPGTATIGNTQHRAAIVTTNVFETPDT